MDYTDQEIYDIIKKEGKIRAVSVIMKTRQLGLAAANEHLNYIIGKFSPLDQPEPLQPRPKIAVRKPDYASIAIVLTISIAVIGVLYIPAKRETEKSSIYNSALKSNTIAGKKANSADHINSKPSRLIINDVNKSLAAFQLICLDAKMEGSCLWVMIADDGIPKNGVAKQLCPVAQMHGGKCVTIFDMKLGRLGHSNCN